MDTGELIQTNSRTQQSANRAVRKRKRRTSTVGVTRKPGSCSLLGQTYFLSPDESRRVENALLRAIPSLYQAVSNLVCEYLKPKLKFPQLLDVLDETKKWLQATALCQSESGYVAVHYNGYGCVFDDWICITSPRLAPLNTYTQQLNPKQFSVFDAEYHLALLDYVETFSHKQRRTLTQVAYRLFCRITENKSIVYDRQPSDLLRAVCKFTMTLPCFQRLVAAAISRNTTIVDSMPDFMPEQFVSDALEEFQRRYSPVELSQESRLDVDVLHYHSASPFHNQSRVMQFASCPEEFPLVIGENKYNRRSLNQTAIRKVKHLLEQRRNPD
jgi:hypothetical protein